MWPRSPIIAALTLAWVMQAPNATAKDLDDLSRVVTPAYIAMNIVAACLSDDAGYAVATSGPRGTAFHYAEHVKDEAIAGLTYDEAVAVLTTAATAARTAVRLALADATAQEAGSIGPWCSGRGVIFVRAFMESHDIAHEQLLAKMEKAKQ